MARKRQRLRVLEHELARRHPELQDPRAAILRGDVLVDGIARTNPASLLRPGASITLRRPRRLRGGEKLAFALQAFEIDARGRTALDVGAGAGGFTSALLEAGARRVYAVDAGHGQLLGSLRLDPRVVNLEATNVSTLDRRLVPEPVDIVAVDLSYLALRDAAPQLAPVAFGRSVDAIALVKPQFELKRASVPTARQDLAGAAVSAADGFASAGWQIAEVIESPIRGAGGAIELFLHARRAG
ncbi:MAG TPA: SAM-dependent methyltransferase [Gaiellaceae bacterium]|nr:SAM-dependent methyltransferase [Gaiellaceae bacterium]